MNLNLYIFYIQTLLDLRWFNLQFVKFTMVGGQYAFSRTILPVLNSDLFLGQQCVVGPSPVMPGSGSHSSSEGPRIDMLAAILLLTFSTVLNKVQEILNTSL